MDSGSIIPVDGVYFSTLREDALKQEIARLERQNAGMLAMPKRIYNNIADGGESYRELTRLYGKYKILKELDQLIKKVEGDR